MFTESTNDFIYFVHLKYNLSSFNLTYLNLDAHSEVHIKCGRMLYFSVHTSQRRV